MSVQGGEFPRSMRAVSLPPPRLGEGIVAGQTDTLEGAGVTSVDVRFGSKADMCGAKGPKADIERLDTRYFIYGRE